MITHGSETAASQRAQPLDLFSPVQLGPYELPNRIVMAPMTRNRAGAGNVPQPLNAVYYAQRASAGLIVTEASQVSAQGVGYPHTPGIHSPEQVVGWQRITSAVHDRGGRIFLQLWHVGRISHPSLQPDGGAPVAPSPIRPEGQVYTYEGPKPFATPRALEKDEIPGVVEQFRAGAENALKANFDGVEIHAANGYLLDQFLRDGTNRRTDAYGGPVENRVRLLLETVSAVSSVWGADRVGVRISPLNPFNDIADSKPGETFAFLTEELNAYGLAYLHVVETGSDNAEETRAVMERVRAAFDGNYMANGGYDKARADRSLQAGQADLVSFGALYLANPDLPERFMRDAPLNAPDTGTFYGGDERGYTDYPELS